MLAKRSYLEVFFVFLISVMFICCKGEDPMPPDPGTDKPGKGQTDVPDGMVRLFVNVDDGGVFCDLSVPSLMVKARINVNGTECKAAKDADGKYYVDVKESSKNEYTAYLVTDASSKWYGDTPYGGIKLPYSQFCQKTINEFADVPRFAKASGGTLNFKSAAAFIDIAVKGKSKLSSIKIRNVSGTALAGTANYLPTSGVSIIKGVSFVVLNCTNNGNFISLSDTEQHFHIPIFPGNYSDGLEITVCGSDHLYCRQTLKTNLKSGEVKKVSIDYKPENDLVFYEAFDNFVWGGDIMGGNGTVGYAPSSDEVTYNSSATRKGDEESWSEVSCTTPGTPFIQSNTWSDVNGKDLSSSHSMPVSYVQSRNLSDWNYMFRTQEFQGLVAVGLGGTGGTNGRGIVQTPAFTAIKGMRTIRINFDFCYQSGASDDLYLQTIGAAITEVKVNGKVIAQTAQNSGYIGAGSNTILKRDYVSIPSSETAGKTWNNVEILAEEASDGTMLYFAGNTSDSGVHGFYLDNIEVRTVGKEEERSPKTLRVLYWNIQNGMWADQANNFDNFVAWVKKYDPDVCVWCESSSIYKDNTNTSAPEAERILPSGWPSIAARYGHNYTATGGKRDNYPQTVTSKFPIETILKITDTETAGKPVSHGAGIQSVNVNGRKIWFVTLHLWPQAYGFGIPSSEQEASKARFEGDYYREYEMKYILEKTVCNPQYASQTDWLMMGDFNSRSPYDNWYYNYDPASTALLAQTAIKENCGLIDIIATRYPGRFVSSTMGNARIDYMFASPSMFGAIKSAVTITDKWTTAKVSKYYSGFYDPSDHRPIVVDFDL